MDRREQKIDKIHMMPNGIVINSIVDGPGLRTAIFTNYCAHRCFRCHNPETWFWENGIDMDFQTLINQIEDDNITLTGGDPFFQATALYNFLLLYKERKPESTVWIYSGFTFEEILEDEDKVKLLQQCDVLVDGKFDYTKKSLDLKWAGSSNQRLIDVHKSLQQGVPILWESMV